MGKGRAMPARSDNRGDGDSASRGLRARTGPRRDLLALAGFVALCLSVAAAGGAVTATSVGTWYQSLEKPPFNPPDWVFAPVWTTLYLLMAVAAWRVWRAPGSPKRVAALADFSVQLALNLAWSVLFFGLQLIAAALVEILFLLAAITMTTIRFRRIDPLAGTLFLPYLLWVAYATILNAALWWLN